MTAGSASTSPHPARRNRRALYGLLVAVAALAAGGAALETGASRLRVAEVDAGLRREAPAIDRSDALSQNLAIFSLGGPRSLAAGILSLDATNAWLAGDWPLAERRWESVTTLAPMRVNYWISASRDMAVNAETSVRHDKRLDRVQQATLSRRYYDRGVRFLKDAIANNPESSLLYVRLGDTLSDLYRYPRFAEAAEAYHRAVELGAPRQCERMEFYNLCRVRGKEKEAYTLGRKLFADERNRVPSLLNLLFVLQNRMGLPENERLSLEELYGSEEEARDYLESYRYNAIRLPVDGVAEFLDKR